MAEVSEYYKDLWRVFDYDLPWDKLSGCNILVTGATGLIGGCLVDALMLNPQIDYCVYASGRKEDRLLNRFSKFLHYPGFYILTYDVLRPLESQIRYDYIIHTASNASPSSFANTPVEVMKSNLYGVCNLIDYGVNSGMKRFLFVSSGEVYGEGDGRVFTEDYYGYVNCTSSRSCYPSAKRAAETICASYRAEYGVDVVIARPCHVYGPFFTESDNRVYAQFIRNLLSGQDIEMKSSGSQFRSWCYVVDCVTALLHILLKGESGEAYNIADPLSNVSIKELATMVAKIGNKKVFFSLPDQNEIVGFNPVTKSVFSIDKIKSLGWTPRTSIKEGIKHTIHTLQDINKESL